MRPDFSLVVGGSDITATVADRLMSMTITDEVGTKSDQVDIALDNRDLRLALPPDGAILAVSLDYRETGLIPQGLFTVDDAQFAGPPDKLTLRGRAAQLGGSIKDQKTRAWDNVTINDITATIAAEHGLTVKVAADLASVRYDHIDQTAESDIALLLRLAEEHDAIATVKGRTLLYLRQGAGLTASGLAIVPVTINRRGASSYTLRREPRQSFGAVEARWQDADSGRQTTIRRGDGPPHDSSSTCTQTRPRQHAPPKRRCKGQPDQGGPWMSLFLASRRSVLGG